MTSRLPLGILSAALASAIAAPLHAAPAPPAPVDSVTYHIERHNQQVIVKDADEKTLTTFSAATPTLQGIFLWSAPGPVANTPRTLVLTLKDQNGQRLWSTPVAVTYPQTINVSFNTNADGTQLVINTTQDNPSNLDYPPASGLVFVVGADGRPMSFGDASHQYKYVYEAHSFSVVDKNGKIFMHGDTTGGDVAFRGPDGSGLSGQAHFNEDGTGTMQLNGTTVVVDKATKDGKTYQSFPWNGHKVLVENSCIWSVTTDGDLTVNAPGTTKTTASK